MIIYFIKIEYALYCELQYHFAYTLLPQALINIQLMNINEEIQTHDVIMARLDNTNESDTDNNTNISANTANTTNMDIEGDNMVTNNIIVNTNTTTVPSNDILDPNLWYKQTFSASAAVCVHLIYCSFLVYAINFELESNKENDREIHCVSLKSYITSNIVCDIYTVIVGLLFFCITLSEVRINYKNLSAYWLGVLVSVIISIMGKCCLMFYGIYHLKNLTLQCSRDYQHIAPGIFLCYKVNIIYSLCAWGLLFLLHIKSKLNIIILPKGHSFIDAFDESHMIENENREHIREYDQINSQSQSQSIHHTRIQSVQSVQSVQSPHVQLPHTQHFRMNKCDIENMGEDKLEQITSITTCTVCTDSFHGLFICVPCGHACLCPACYNELSSKSCPICRKTITQVIMVYQS